MPPFDNLKGRHFGRLLVIEVYKDKKAKSGNYYWLCLCNCGKEAIVRGTNLKHNVTKSCGCLGKTESILLAQKANIKHNMSKTRFHSIWLGIKIRCNNTELWGYKYYGGRGITYDPRWNDFLEFKKDMYFDYLRAIRIKKIKKPSIERKDNNGNYCKENCCWIPRNEQAKNRRNMREFMALSPDGILSKEKNIRKFAKEKQLSFGNIHGVLVGRRKQHKGWLFYFC